MAYWIQDLRNTKAMRFLSFIIISHLSQMSVIESSNPEPPTARDQKKKNLQKSLINLADQVKCD